MRRLYFVGVSTAGSSIMTIFPAFVAALGLDAEIRGIDLPVDAPAGRVRDALAALRADQDAAGALVTTHKAAVYDHGRDWFDELDDWARLCREVSCIAFRPDRVLGWAKDPITSRQAYTALLGEDPWRDSSTDVVCLGVGGAGLALATAVLSERHQPRRLVLTDSDPGRLDIARDVLGRLPGRAFVDYHLAGADVDRLVAEAAPGSLVVNATGLGKDRPGSPLGDTCTFPDRGVIWDMNYRGDLQFLDQARRQEAARGLTVADGWRYFLHGWTEVIAEVFEIPIDAKTFATLADLAAGLTGRSETGATRG